MTKNMTWVLRLSQIRVKIACVRSGGAPFGTDGREGKRRDGRTSGVGLSPVKVLAKGASPTRRSPSRQRRQ